MGPEGHKKSHPYHVMDKLATPLFTAGWAAGEELALVDHVRTKGLCLWEALVESDLFYRRRTAEELQNHYLSTHLGRHGSVIPSHHVQRRDDGSLENVPVPLSDPDTCTPALRGVEVDSRELRERTMADLGTTPVHKYEPSWQARAKKEEDAMTAAATAAATTAAATATASTAAAAAATASAATATASTATATAAATASTATATAATATAVAASAADTSSTATAAAATPTAATASAATASAATATAAATAAPIAAIATTAATTTATATATATADPTATATAASGSGSMAALGGSGSGGGGGGGGQKRLGKAKSGPTARATAAPVKGEKRKASAAKRCHVSGKRPRLQRVSRTKLEKERAIREEEERLLAKEERAIRQWVGKLPGAALDSYDPLRGEFTHEEDDSTEALLEDMVFGADDDPRERKIKLDVTEVYNHRVDVREKQKEFLEEHNLLDFTKRRVTRSRKKTQEDDHDIKVKMGAKIKEYEPFSAVEEHADLVDNLTLTEKLRAKLAELEAQRQNGVGTMAGGLEFEVDKKKVREKARGIRSSGPGDRGGDQQPANLMSITGAPGLEFLSQSEILLCMELHMLPAYYLGIKETMSREYARVGYLSKTNLSALIILDVGRLHKICDFFVGCGWATDEPNN